MRFCGGCRAGVSCRGGNGHGAASRLRGSAREREPGDGVAAALHQRSRGHDRLVNVSPATGSLRLFINDRAGTIDYELTYDNLVGTVTQSHIHVGQMSVNGGITLWLCGTSFSATTPGPAGTPTCPAGRSGTVTGTLTAANVQPITAQLVTAGDLDDVIRAIRSGVAYGNVHSTVELGGEIRAQLH